MSCQIASDHRGSLIGNTGIIHTPIEHTLDSQCTHLAYHLHNYYTSLITNMLCDLCHMYNISACVPCRQISNPVMHGLHI